MQATKQELIEFDGFRLDTERLVLTYKDEVVPMPLKEIQLLAILAENQGKLVSKDELMERLWSNTYVEEGNLSRQIYMLRKTLAEYSGRRSLIENVPKRGYRFAAEVRNVPLEIVYERFASSETTIEETIIEDRERSLSNFRISQKHWLVKAVAFGIVVLAVALFALIAAKRGVTGAEKIHSIAVLPMKTINDADRHRGLGLADSVITRMSVLRSVNVRPTSAVSAYEDVDKNIDEIANELKVDAVLEGTIFRSGSGTRVTARLIRSSDQRTIWAGQFDKKPGDDISIENDIAIQIADSLALNLSENERDALRSKASSDPDAFDLYERGRIEWNKRSYQGVLEAERLFRDAIDRDPNFSLAYAELSNVLATGGNPPLARASADKALALDPNLGEAHASLGFIKMFNEWDWDGAEAELKHSIELNPGYLPAHQWYANLLEIEGRSVEAREEFERALEIDPNSYNVLADLGQAYYFDHQYDKAQDFCRRAAELDPNFLFAHEYLSEIDFMKGDMDGTVLETLASERINSTFPNQTSEQSRSVDEYIQRWSDIYRRVGLKGFLERRVTQSPDTPAGSHYIYAKRYAMLGDRRRAILALDQAVKAKEFLAPFCLVDPIFDPERGDEEFAKIANAIRHKS